MADGWDDRRHVPRLYFIAKDETFGTEPWVSDGSLAGTHGLADICPGRCSSEPSSFVTLGDTIFFAAYDPSAGRELWAAPVGCGDCPSRRRSAGH